MTQIADASRAFKHINLILYLLTYSATISSKHNFLVKYGERQRRRESGSEGERMDGCREREREVLGAQHRSQAELREPPAVQRRFGPLGMADSNGLVVGSRLRLLQPHPIGIAGRESRSRPGGANLLKTSKKGRRTRTPPASDSEQSRLELPNLRQPGAPSGSARRGKRVGWPT